MDFEIFPLLKKELRGVRHENQNELEQHVQTVVRGFDRQLYGTGFDKWISRHQKCIDAKGQYSRWNMTMDKPIHEREHNHCQQLITKSHGRS